MPKFQKGQSGNPAGRPPRSDTEKALREKVRKAAPGIIDKLLQAADDGDTAAAKLLLERVMPALKPVDQPIQLPIGADGDLANAGRIVLAALAGGELTPGEAKEITASLATVARVTETGELIERIERLEAAIAAGANP